MKKKKKNQIRSFTASSRTKEWSNKIQISGRFQNSTRHEFTTIRELNNMLIWFSRFFSKQLLLDEVVTLVNRETINRAITVKVVERSLAMEFESKLAFAVRSVFVPFSKQLFWFL